MTRILFLYATENSGHKKAADIIRQNLHIFNKSIQTKGVGLFALKYPVLAPFLYKLYLDTVQSMPLFWGYLYNNSDIAAFFKDIKIFLNSLGIAKLKKKIKEMDPKVIVSTQALPACFVAFEKSEGAISVPHIVVITDFVANHYWPCFGVDCYCVPNEEIRQDLIGRKFPKDRIFVSGIPIDKSFLRKEDKFEARKKMGLDTSLQTVLLMGGTAGIGDILDIAKKLILYSEEIKIQLVIVSGRNRKLYRELKRSYGFWKNVRILGYTKKVSRLMDAADILVSKPGGLTCAEAMAKGIPMAMIAPLPGQEEKNAEYLCKIGAAAMCPDIDHLPAVIKELLHAPEEIARMRTALRNAAKPDAAAFIVSKIEGFIVPEIKNLPARSSDGKQKHISLHF